MSKFDELRNWDDESKKKEKALEAAVKDFHQGLKGVVVSVLETNPNDVQVGSLSPDAPNYETGVKINVGEVTYNIPLYLLRIGDGIVVEIGSGNARETAPLDDTKLLAEKIFEGLKRAIPRIPPGQKEACF